MENTKERKIGNDRILKYIKDDYYPYTSTIMEIFLNEEKHYRLCRWDDYAFVGWSNEGKEINKLSFEFDKSHPLYIPLLHLINYDEELIIDDDDTYEMNKKYLLIHKDEDIIKMKFINNLNANELLAEKFRVFIKNIGLDCRSKIDCQYKDTKERLFYFFKETREIITNDYHQMTIEEYTINNNPEVKTAELKKYKIKKELKYGINKRM